MGHAAYEALMIVLRKPLWWPGTPGTKHRSYKISALYCKSCRRAGIPVIYVRHDGGKGDELERGTDGGKLTRRLPPQPGEVIFDKQYNSAFLGYRARCVTLKSGYQPLYFVRNADRVLY